jgi:hypothetical protein
VLRYDYRGLLAALEREGQRFYVAADHVGTPRVVTDASGAVIEAVDHDSYGVETNDSNPSFALPVGFAGGLTDPTTGSCASACATTTQPSAAGPRATRSSTTVGRRTCTRTPRMIR